MDYLKKITMENLRQNEKEIRNLDSGAEWRGTLPNKKHNVWLLLIAIGLVAAVITLSVIGS